MGRTYVRSFARIQGESTNINFSLARFDPILTGPYSHGLID